MFITRIITSPGEYICAERSHSCCTINSCSIVRCCLCSEFQSYTLTVVGIVTPGDSFLLLTWASSIFLHISMYLWGPWNLGLRISRFEHVILHKWGENEVFYMWQECWGDIIGHIRLFVIGNMLWAHLLASTSIVSGYWEDRGDKKQCSGWRALPQHRRSPILIYYSQYSRQPL